MLSWFVSRKIDAFEREYAYDMDYMRKVLEAGARPAVAFARAGALGDYRMGVPEDAWHAAKLVAIRAEDCGPCVQLTATMAQRSGQTPEWIAAVLEDRLETLPDDVKLSVAFTKAVLARSPDTASLRKRVVERFGTEGLVSIAFAIVSSRLYPTLKLALGYAQSCSVVRVGDSLVRTLQESH